MRVDDQRSIGSFKSIGHGIFDSLTFFGKGLSNETFDLTFIARIVEKDQEMSI